MVDEWVDIGLRCVSGGGNKEGLSEEVTFELRCVCEKEAALQNRMEVWSLHRKWKCKGPEAEMSLECLGKPDW